MVSRYEDQGLGYYNDGEVLVLGKEERKQERIKHEMAVGVGKKRNRKEKLSGCRREHQNTKYWTRTQNNQTQTGTKRFDPSLHQ